MSFQTNQTRKRGGQNVQCVRNRSALVMHDGIIVNGIGCFTDEYLVVIKAILFPFEDGLCIPESRPAGGTEKWLNLNI